MTNFAKETNNTRTMTKADVVNDGSCKRTRFGSYNIKRNVVCDNPIWDEDRRLFEDMAKNAVSENEREFFEVQHYKQVNNFASANDLVMSEHDNPDHLYIVRENFDEYIIGVENIDKEIHTMSLFQALNTNLKDAGLLARDITLWEWLRERDYRGIEYDHNYDDI